MTPLPDLASLERTAFRGLFDDGVFDVALGLWLTVWSLLILAGSTVLGAVLIVPALVLWERLRGRLVGPRAGEVRFRQRSRRQRLVVMVTACVALLAAGVLLAASRGSGPRAVEDFFAASPHLLLVLPMALLLATLAAVFRVGRLALHAGLLLALLAAGDGLRLPFPWSMTAAGAAILAIGAAVLSRFLATHPIANAE